METDKAPVKEEADWLCFRQLMNKCTSLIKCDKLEFYLAESMKNLNDPKKFWKTIISSYGHVPSNDLNDVKLLRHKVW